MTSFVNTSNKPNGPRTAVSSVSAQDVPGRWSQLGASRPAMVIVPSSEDEIIAAIQLATTKNWRVIPVGGGHSPFVPINEKSVLLDMRKFNHVSVGTGSVTIGGGSTAGDVIQACAEKQCYTLTPNSNAVGMVGFLLGGGSSSFNGIHGLAAEHIMEVRMITADGLILHLSSSSTGAERELFSAIRGAGHGLGVITSLTMPTFSISVLNMPNDCVSVRRITFPLAALDHATMAFLKLQERVTGRSKSRLLSSIMFLRAPPGLSQVGEPLIYLTAAYYGSASDAERCTLELYDPDLLQHSLTASSSTIPLHKMNDGTESLNITGGYKQLGNALLASADLEGIQQGIHAWLRFGDSHPDAKEHTIIFWGTWSTSPMPRSTFLQGSDRTAFLQVLVWYTERNTHEPAREFMEDMLNIGRRNDANNGVAALTFPNNQLLGGKIGEIYSPEAVQRIKRVKALWDSGSLFWSPAIDSL
ncbi:uncharacterized protein N7496_005754 [Penicillium cataractarum]|uniref:FAD-binding PCMH-type domain-containing protein n=1 Tax=Penicillium cataractarum TaxID=2100454 RepID=A0A9W9SHZ4_9EURO|nr:uncharacterized protein N7496_005754 [Penicillium cataractarum]KAJ5378345.1 hypothetical protein N7496_005754 [Penicillium cataractarum]